MRLNDSQLGLSATDLMNFKKCRHLTNLDLRYLEIGDIQPAEESEEIALLQKHGDLREQRQIQSLRDDGYDIAEIDTQTEDRGRMETIQAMKSGREVIIQASLQSGQWSGFADFLYRVDASSKLGNWSYEVSDTKLSRSPKPEQVLQVSLYSDFVAKIQKTTPKQAHIDLGDDTRFTFNLSEYGAYTRYSRRSLETFIANRPETRPIPNPFCKLCRWRNDCKETWESTDSLVLVANIVKSQREKLEAAGVTTMTALSKLKTPIPRLAELSQEKLVQQAKLQVSRRNGNSPSFALKPHIPGRGFDLLPKASEGDIFYDIEGNPFLGKNGLDYLHGFCFIENGQVRYKDFWVHDISQEAETIREIIEFFIERIRIFPDAHIYHYAPYELTSLRRSTSKNKTCEELLDVLLRHKRFIDLYKIVQGGFFTSEPGYTLKDLEVFYMPKRDEEVSSGFDSIVAYDNWLETKDQSILTELRDYNEKDCRSLGLLRDWIIKEVRPKKKAWAESIEIAFVGSKPKTQKRKTSKRNIDEKEQLLDPDFGDAPNQMLHDVKDFHNREDKPVWWGIFDRIGKESDELIKDAECLAGLKLQTKNSDTEDDFEYSGKRKRNSRHTRISADYFQTLKYKFPEQETKLKLHDNPSIFLNNKIENTTIAGLDTQNCVVELITETDSSLPRRLDLLPPKPYNTKALANSLRNVIELLADGNPLVQAAEQFVIKSVPLFHDNRKNILNGKESLVDQTVDAVEKLFSSTLIIQGPPGTGKTYTSAKAIVNLVKHGKRVAVTSNSHKAITNLLKMVAEFAIEERIDIDVGQKVRELDIEKLPDNYFQTTENYHFPHTDVVGGTVWLLTRFCKSPRSRNLTEQAFDYLFVDEAGQVSAANLIAISSCAENIVLVGDPLELAQPIKASHPGESGDSCLEYLMKDKRVVPAAQGIFLETSRRMHPSVCNFISEMVYEGKLLHDKAASEQQLIDKTGRSLYGVHFVNVFHEHRSQHSPEEIKAIQNKIKFLIGSQFTDRNGDTTKIRHEDIMVVAPFNAQVNALESALPKKVRIGTIDKFQGQEAPICLISMTSSSGAEVPRGMEFLFSLNRINVAVSRAKIYALVFASNRLLDTPCNTVEQMRLLNTFCHLEEQTKLDLV